MSDLNISAKTMGSKVEYEAPYILLTIFALFCIRPESKVITTKGFYDFLCTYTVLYIWIISPRFILHPFVLISANLKLGELL